MKKKKGKVKRVKRRGITLVLSGGSAKGLAHIGVLEVLDKNKIPIKRVIGTSAGALVGGFYCAGKLDVIKNISMQMSKKKILKLFLALPTLRGLINTKKVDLLLKKYIEGVKIENLKTPFIAVAFDIKNGRKYMFDRGDLFKAIRSSIAIPGVFAPFEIGNSILVDGGVTDVVPIEVAKKFKDNDEIVVVNLETLPNIEIKNFNIFNIIDYATSFGLAELARLEEKDADVIIHPYTKVRKFDFYKADEIINEGRIATRKAIPMIKEKLKRKK